MRYVLIMAGGSGKRLWPLSRQDMPKQLLKVLGGRSLLRIAFDRLDGIVPAERVFVCTGADYADVVRAELPEVPAANILGEPEGRDSLNAVAWPAAVLAERDPAAVVAVVTADQIMHPVAAFGTALEEGFEVAETDPSALVTFGVVPTSPHTGYGYLERGEECPATRPSARCWRSRRSRIGRWPRPISPRAGTGGTRECSSGGRPPCCEQLQAAAPGDVRLGHRARRQHPDRLAEIYPSLVKISVDYAVMEPVSLGRGNAHVVAVRLPITWHDVGGFAALSEQLPRDSRETRRPARACWSTPATTS